MIVPILASRQVSNIAHRLFDCGTPIFMLHRFSQAGQPQEGRTDPAHLRNCLDYLKENRYIFLSLEELITALNNNATLPPKSVCFTMDDGYIDQAEIAAPIFLEYNCPVTFFIITEMLGHTSWPWDAQVSYIIESSKSDSLHSSEIVKQLNLNHNKISNKREFRREIQNSIKKIDAEIIPSILQQLARAAGITISNIPPENFQPMTWDNARQLEKQGIRFSPHSVSHNILSRLSQKAMEREIRESWQTITHELEKPLKVFCYPTGRPMDFGEREVDILINDNYLGAVSTTPKFVMNNQKSRDYIYSLPRLSLPNDMTDFIQYCSWMEGIKGTLYT